VTTATLPRLHPADAEHLDALAWEPGQCAILPSHGGPTANVGGDGLCRGCAGYRLTLARQEARARESAAG
jgi:hypothetical protein